mmetsp:Transcript_22459/g.44116  ORF Transcript_22459/g.44116 Transcript_22459/m.44116 type:complete len:515 (-) Transcript_22459:58-1602(-)|eukprot:CAMPEP_0171580880 /NCGR_PEP_ID=MMETSP0961-20121227/9281_1 /TAXON_ID=87120 /ORGANISM="Aurantiochytrium limacinum, Strain ATCCMYA-1381" /LENGTH=514 /DNA_ID=CAMNT_0012137601 /DNA_START=534 /DNA_END=2078 /DNA_ORIENTATION=+
MPNSSTAKAGAASGLIEVMPDERRLGSQADDEVKEVTMDQNLPVRSTSAGTQPAKSLSGKIGSIVRWVSDSFGGKKYEAKLMENLRKSTMFRYCSEQSRLSLANSMELETFSKGDVLMIQGEPQTSAIIIVDGSVARLRLIDDQLHQMATLGDVGSTATIGMLHLIREEKAFSTVRALSDGACFRLSAEVFRELLEESPEFAQECVFSLCKEVRAHTKLKRTPLFLQSGKAMPAEPLPWFAVSCAAALESFYRSGLNAILNAKLTGTPRGALFPNMHVQLPTRVLYINGFKGLRHVLDSRVHVSEYDNPELVGLGLAILPGLAMTPISSILEACNAGHVNPEPLHTRWTRGLVPRCGREILFGVGINQLSDFLEERMEIFESQNMRNLGGSLLAGILAGYCSHIPHNLSTLKLMTPSKSYSQLFKELQAPWNKWFDKEFMPMSRTARLHSSTSQPAGRQVLRSILVPVLTCLLPKGALIRTTQIAGSFLIINTTINYLSHINVKVSVSRTPSSA